VRQKKSQGYWTPAWQKNASNKSFKNRNGFAWTRKRSGPVYRIVVDAIGNETGRILIDKAEMKKRRTIEKEMYDKLKETRKLK